MRLKIRCDGNLKNFANFFGTKQGLAFQAACAFEAACRLVIPGACVPKKFCKIFQILCHIKSLDVCMEY